MRLHSLTPSVLQCIKQWITLPFQTTASLSAHQQRTNFLHFNRYSRPKFPRQAEKEKKNIFQTQNPCLKGITDESQLDCPEITTELARTNLAIISRQNLRLVAFHPAIPEWCHPLLVHHGVFVFQTIQAVSGFFSRLKDPYDDLS